MARQIVPTLHQTIRDWLISITQNAAPGSLIPTEVEVAKRFGASRFTAHKVLAELQRDGVVRRVKGLGSFVEARASQIRANDTSARNGRIIIAYPHWFSFDIWAKVERASLVAREMQLDPVEHHITPSSNHDGLRRLISEFGNVRGILLLPPGAIINLRELHSLDSLGVPVILMVPHEQVSLTQRVSSLSKDCFKAGHLMIEALTRHGHSRIAYVANEPWSTSSDLTYDGIKQGLYAAGLRLKDLVRSDERIQQWDNSMDAGRDMTASLLQRDPQITALIYDSVPGAFAGLTAVRASGRRAPEDVSLVVNDAYAGFEEHTWPALTGIAVDRASLMRRALRIITGEIVATDRIMREDVSLVERASIAAAPSAST